MDIELVSFASTRRTRLDSKVVCKVLHLAMFHGWRPERLAEQPPSASWDTQVIVPYIEPYLFGSVSNTDAAALSAGLKRMLASEALGLPAPVHFAAVAILAVAESGSFGLVAESEGGQSDGLPPDALREPQTQAPVSG